MQHVFDVIREIVGPSSLKITSNEIILEDATRRTILIRFSADPDIEIVSLHSNGAQETPLLAIEVKGAPISRTFTIAWEKRKRAISKPKRNGTSRTSGQSPMWPS